jgi:hypothetical protein
VNGEEVCSCGKVRYESQAAAKRVSREKRWYGLTVYECLGFWHLGHPPRKATRRARVKQGRRPR